MCPLAFFYQNLFFFLQKLQHGGCFVSFGRISEGSVIVDGSVEPTAEPGTSDFNSNFGDVNAALTEGGEIAGMKVESSSTSLSVPTVSPSS